MDHQADQDVAAGTVLEFYESREITCGVCIAVKDGRLNVLTGKNREVNLTRSRIVHSGKLSLSPALGRDKLVERLNSICTLRRDIMQQVDLEELWSLLEGEEAGFEPAELAEYLFSTPVTEHQVAAVQRMLLQDRLFFRSKESKFYPRSAEEIERRRIEIEKEAERERRIEETSCLLHAAWTRKPGLPPAVLQPGLIEALKSFALFGQESPESAFVKETLKRAEIPQQPQSAFRLLVRIGVWSEDENLLIHEHGFSPDFSAEAIEQAERIGSGPRQPQPSEGREDLRDLYVFTVDNLFTRDFDDALSARDAGGGLTEIGIHIADAAELIQKDDPLDVEALQRASTIYFPDGRISMLPASLSEDILSLKAGDDRYAVSFLFTLDTGGTVLSKRIVPSVIRVREQLTYQEVSDRAGRGGDESISLLHEFALRFQKERLENGAIILPLPEIQVYVNPAGMIQISRHGKETPSQVMVSEWMIAANALAGSFLAERGVPSIFRNQTECRPETEHVTSEHELFRIYRQRRLFARAELDTEPRAHCSLAVPYYTTVTSPIRRYLDLIVQRQLKHALSNGAPLYSEQELKQVAAHLSAIHPRIFLVQRKWTRYWILKYLEQEDMHTLDALVLDQNPRFAHLLLPDFLIEANAPMPENPRFHPGEMVRIRIEKLSPRDDVFKAQILDIPGR